jgi:hypothetical protein
MSPKSSVLFNVLLLLKHHTIDRVYEAYNH